MLLLFVTVVTVADLLFSGQRKQKMAKKPGKPRKYLDFSGSFSAITRTGH